MNLTSSDLSTRSRIAYGRATRIPPPDCLSRDLHCDWDIVTTVHANLLLIGSSSETGAILNALGPHLRGPICSLRPKPGVVLPESTTGTLIVLEVDGLDSNQQAQLLRWLKQPQTRVQVVCTTCESLFRRVQAGHFLADLYYRLNVVLLDVTPA